MNDFIKNIFLVLKSYHVNKFFNQNSRYSLSLVSDKNHPKDILYLYKEILTTLIKLQIVITRIHIIHEIFFINLKLLMFFNNSFYNLVNHNILF